MTKAELAEQLRIKEIIKIKALSDKQITASYVLPTEDEQYLNDSIRHSQNATEWLDLLEGNRKNK